MPKCKNISFLVTPYMTGLVAKLCLTMLDVLDALFSPSSHQIGSLSAQIGKKVRCLVISIINLRYADDFICTKESWGTHFLSSLSIKSSVAEAALRAKASPISCTF